jgi:8-oxo-dGTP diphosphatase
MKQMMGVVALIFDKSGSILLNYRNKSRPFYPDCWFLPCGMVERDESPIEAIAREVKEETDLSVSVGEEIYNRVNETGSREIAYICGVIRGAAKNMEKNKFDGLRYFPLDRLPQNTGKRTLEMIEGYKRLV